jgi:uncharacterized membrane protein HdeD (DUF308 family)
MLKKPKSQRTEMVTYFLNNLLIIMLFLSLALGACLNGIYRTSSNTTENMVFGSTSLVFIGIPSLIWGIFFLLPRPAQTSFINKSWLRLIPVDKYDSSSPWLFGIVLIILGCLMIMLYFPPFTDLLLQTIFSNTSPSGSILLEPTWTGTP